MKISGSLNRKKSLLALTVAMAVQINTGTSFAQSASGNDETHDIEVVEVVGDTLLLYREKSSSVALFGDTPLIETPFSVSIYNEMLIEDQRAFTLRDVLKNDPSTALQMPGGYYGNQNLGIRGFRVDNFIGYRVDGLPVTQLVSPSIDDKSRVEALKGPAGLRFGFMPPGGAINLVRKRPTEELSSSLQFDVDTFGSIYGQADISDTVADGSLGYRLVLAGDDFDSFYDNADGDRFLGSLFVESEVSDKVRLWGSVSSQKNDRSGYYGPLISGNGVIHDTGPETNTMQDWALNEQESQDAAVGISINFSSNTSFHASANYQDISRDSALSYAGEVMDNGDYNDYGFMTGDYFQWTMKGFHAHLETSLVMGGITHNLVIGGQYRDLQTVFGDRPSPYLGSSNTDTLASFPRPDDPTSYWDSYDYKEQGFFLTDTIQLTDRLSILLGTRFSEFDATDSWEGEQYYEDKQDTWNPTVALMFEPAENVHTYATFTQGIQDGGTASRFAANANEPLGVQESEQVELGVKTELFDGRLYSEIALFQIEQDLVLTDPDNNIEALSGLQEHRGLELSVSGLVSDQLQAGIGAMFLDAEQVDTGFSSTDGKRPQHVPEYQANLWTSYEFPEIEGLAVNANIRFVGDQYADQEEVFATDSYSVFDLGARYNFDLGANKITLRLNIENMFDESYFETSEFYAGWGGYLAYGAPLNANFSIQMDF